MTDEARASGERAQKVLARVGIASRRAIETMISAGRVSINGVVARLGDRIDVTSDRVLVDGIPVQFDVTLVYYLLNKPAKVVSTASDPQRRATVIDLVPAAPRVVPVGRLDYHSEGLLLLTNDGELTNLLTHPSHGVDKTYLVEVEGAPTGATLRHLADGVMLDDGLTAPARVRLVQRTSEGAAIELVIHEGRNRQVRRMCEAVGHPVSRLVRTRIGPLHDPALRPGKWRALSAQEVRDVYAAALGTPH